MKAIKATDLPWVVKIQTQYSNTSEFIEEGLLSIGYSVLAFAGNKGQITWKIVGILNTYQIQSQALLRYLVFWFNHSLTNDHPS